MTKSKIGFGKRMVAALVAMLMTSMAWAGEAPAIPEGGETLLGEKTLDQYVLRARRGAVAEKTIEAEESGQFKQYTRVAVTTPGKPWDAALDINLGAKVSNGDVIFLRFYYRAAPSPDGTSAGKLSAQVGEWKEPYAVAMEQKLTATGEWQRCDLSAAVAQDFDPSKTELTFLLGSVAQTIDIADVQLVNFHTTVSKETLPADGAFLVEK
jgi:hypothetical protein